MLFGLKLSRISTYACNFQFQHLNIWLSPITLKVSYCCTMIIEKCLNFVESPKKLYFQVSFEEYDAGEVC